jgi:hypothetical protein
MGESVVDARRQNVSVGSQDQARIVCNGEILLSVPPGRYTLELTVTDELSKISTTQQTRITVE